MFGEWNEAKAWAVTAVAAAITACVIAWCIMNGSIQADQHRSQICTTTWVGSVKTQVCKDQ